MASASMQVFCTWKLTDAGTRGSDRLGTADMGVTEERNKKLGRRFKYTSRNFPTRFLDYDGS